MRFSTTALVLGTFAAGQAVAASISHYQGKVHNHAERHADLMKAHHERRTIDHRDTSLISTADTQSILKLGVTSVGTNAVSSGSTAWIGSDGAFTNTFHNTASEDLVLVVWGVAGSWVNAVKPQITISIPQNGSKTVSFPSGWSGAWAPIYSGSSLTNGQVFDTWGEATFTPPYSVVDVSREVNMNGNSMSIVGPQCTTNMDTCVFTCKGSASTCLDQYQLVNCATGSQAGANFGTWNGADAGGCGGMGSSAQLNTYLG